MAIAFDIFPSSHFANATLKRICHGTIKMGYPLCA
jgi:hypothetical protein